MVCRGLGKGKAQREHVTTMDSIHRGKGAIILLARLDSRRLPGKQLLEITRGLSILDLVVNRLKRTRHGIPLILATTYRVVDHPLRDFAAAHGIALFEGDLDNVAKRCLDCAQAHDLDWFVRICADSPFMTPEIVDLVIDRFLEKACDLACNIFPRTCPMGTSAEVISRAAMKRICQETDDLSVLEHVTLYAYENPDKFSIVNMTPPGGAYDVTNKLVVDTPADLERARWIASQLPNPATATLEEILTVSAKWPGNGEGTDEKDQI